MDNLVVEKQVIEALTVTVHSYLATQPMAPPLFSQFTNISLLPPIISKLYHIIKIQMFQTTTTCTCTPYCLYSFEVLTKLLTLLQLHLTAFTTSNIFLHNCDPLKSTIMFITNSFQINRSTFHLFIFINTHIIYIVELYIQCCAAYKLR